MYGTIESTHTKIIDKIKIGRVSLEYLMNNHDDNIFRKLHDVIEIIEEDYNLDIVNVLMEYYSGKNEEETTKEYYRIINCKNYIQIVNNQLDKIASQLIKYNADTSICKKLENAKLVAITNHIEKKNHNVCSCGERMVIIPESSRIHCPKCKTFKTVIGMVFRDEQFYNNDYQKVKHSGYDTSRHYRFHMERLQALENKTFPPQILKNMEYVIGRDKYDKNKLTCDQVRRILKDSKVNSTKLNDHAPLLVKLLGGNPPPQLNFEENKIASVRFSKSMQLYDTIVSEKGNKPYYPYFIFKILEHLFRNNPEKRRILNYIHLQSRETVVKNDKTFEKICELSEPEDGLVYTPTDPVRN